MIFYNCLEGTPLEAQQKEKEFYINKLIDRGVNSNVVEQLNQLNIALFNRNMRY